MLGELIKERIYGTRSKECKIVCICNWMGRGGRRTVYVRRLAPWLLHFGISGFVYLTEQWINHGIYITKNKVRGE